MNKEKIIEGVENELLTICNEVKSVNDSNIASLCKKYKVDNIEELQEVMDIRKTIYFRLRNNKPMEFFAYKKNSSGIREIRCKVMEFKNPKTCRIKLEDNSVITIQRVRNSIEWIDDNKNVYLFNSYSYKQ